MTNRITVFALIAAAGTLACGTTEPSGIDFSSFTGARVEVLAEGGIAALSISDRITHDDRTFAHVQRRVCTASCPAPSDSASGVLTAAKTDSVFTIIAANAPGLKDDYGITGQAADMFVYTVRLTTSTGTKTIRADDGTMPQPLRRIVDAVRGTISAARQ
jgi:hypothetical protein